jgi:hypothetical protein
MQGSPGHQTDIAMTGASKMEIKDISVAVERLEDVRGGQTNTLVQSLKQSSGNVAAAEAYGFGVGNETSALNSISAPQSAVQNGAIVATEKHSFEVGISESVIGGFFPYSMR